jgi:iron complex outermembrane receptor protein
MMTASELMISGLLTLAGCGLASAQAETGSLIELDIESKSLETAIYAWSEKTGYQVLIPTEPASDRLISPALKGTYTAEGALRTLLASSDLQYEFVNARTVAIRTRVAQAPTEQQRGPQATAAPIPGQQQDQRSRDVTRSSIEEVLVTANRREQRAQDVAASLQVFDGTELERNGADGFADYLTTVPGLSFRDQGNGANRITVRGVSNIGGYDLGNGSVSTTGLYLNDVPVQGTSIAPDVALYDIARVEVLKGPQGTLYGEGAMGGAIRMILNSPSLTQFEGKADLSLSSAEDGGFNYRVRGVANLPLVDERVGVRLVGTYLDEDGFVDNVARGAEDHDEKRMFSLRGILAAKITDTLSAELLALHNVLEQDDFAQIEKGLGDSRIASAEDRYNEIKGTLLALTLKKDLGSTEFTSITSNYTLDRDFVDRVVFGSLFFSSFGPVAQDPYRVRPDLNKSLSQELRLVSQGDRRFDWVVGAFYRDKEQKTPASGSIAPEELAAVNAGLAAASQPQLGSDGTFFIADTEQTYEQYALYGEGNLELGTRFELTLGLRWFDEETNSITATTGFGILAPFSSPPLAIPVEDNGFIPKIALAFQATQDSILYAQAAKGFRSGVANLNLAFGGDAGAESDSLWSYEIGSKNTLANGRAIFNASAFYLDWTDIQVIANVPSPLIGTVRVFENAGDAEIYGFETQLATAVANKFMFGLALGYTHSELTSAGVQGIGLVGSVLPSTPEWTGSAYGEYRVPVSLGDAFARFDVRYTDEQNTAVVQTPAGVEGLPLDSHTIGNLRVGLDGSNGWGVSLFVENLWNEQAELGRGLETLTGTNQSDRFTVSRPRTYGVSLFKTF